MIIVFYYKGKDISGFERECTNWHLDLSIACTGLIL